jgi:hypothetical protein
VSWMDSTLLSQGGVEGSKSELVTVPQAGLLWMGMLLQVLKQTLGPWWLHDGNSL